MVGMTDVPVDAAARSMANWPVAHGYVGKATPREGNGWQVRIYAHDEEAADHARLVGMTECATLERVEEKTWEFVRALDDSEDVRVAAGPDIGDDLMHKVISAWAAMKQAKEAEAQAALQIRQVVKELRRRGLSVTDIAFLAHISRGRVSQLLL